MQRPTYHPYYLAEVEAAEERAALEYAQQKPRDVLAEFVTMLAGLRAVADHYGIVFTRAYDNARQQMR